MRVWDSGTEAERPVTTAWSSTEEAGFTDMKKVTAVGVRAIRITRLSSLGIVVDFSHGRVRRNGLHRTTARDGKAQDKVV